MSSLHLNNPSQKSVNFSIRESMFRLSLQPLRLALLTAGRRGHVFQGTFIPQGHPVYVSARVRKQVEGDQGGKSGITWPFYFSTRSVWPSVCPHKRTLKVSRIVDRESLRFSTWFESRSRNRESTTRPCSNWEDLIVSFLFFFSPVFVSLFSIERIEIR